MKIRFLLISTILLLFVSYTCSDKKSSNDSENDSSITDNNENSESIATVSVYENMGIAELTDAVIDIQIDACESILALVSDKPDTDSIINEAYDLLEESKQKLIPIGRAREELDEEQKHDFDSQFIQKRRNIPSHYANDLADAIHYYRAQGRDIDYEMQIILDGFNHITNYVFFEIIHSQDLEEAEFLGIDK